MSDGAIASEQQLVVFTLANESYGVDIAKVSGIERMQEITKVPRTPSFVEGVINLRGRVIPVVHLRKLFYLPEGEITKETRIVVVDIDGQPIGVQVDEVTEVLTISTNSVEPPSTVIASADSDYLVGIANLEDKMVILLDLDKVMNNKQSPQVSRINSFRQADSSAKIENGDTEAEETKEFEAEIEAELELSEGQKGKTGKTKAAKSAK